MSTSLIRNSPPPKALGIVVLKDHRGARFHMSEVPLQGQSSSATLGVVGCPHVDMLGVHYLSGRVPREQKMLKGHLPRVLYHQLY